MATTYRRSFADDSDDEIVWSLSDRREPRVAPTLSPSCSLVSDFSSDFVIVSNPLSPVLLTNPSIPYGSQSRSTAGSPQHSPITTFNVPLTKQVANLRISGNAKGSTEKDAKKARPVRMQDDENQPASTKKQQKQAKKTKRKLVAPGDAYPSPSPSPKAQKTATQAPPKVKKGPRGKKSNATKTTVPRGSTDVRPAVPTEIPSLYEEASTFISRFLSNSEAKNDSVCRLTLLQSLIIELGLATSNLPTSLTSARAFLKARAFLNIREYIAVRSQGPDAIQKALYPSKSALIKNFKKNKRNRAPLQWVKDMGLQVLLVGWAH